MLTETRGSRWSSTNSMSRPLASWVFSTAMVGIGDSDETRGREQDATRPMHASRLAARTGPFIVASAAMLKLFDETYKHGFRYQSNSETIENSTPNLPRQLDDVGSACAAGINQ